MSHDPLLSKGPSKDGDTSPISSGSLRDELLEKSHRAARSVSRRDVGFHPDESNAVPENEVGKLELSGGVESSPGLYRGVIDHHESRAMEWDKWGSVHGSYGRNHASSHCGDVATAHRDAASAWRSAFDSAGMHGQGKPDEGLLSAAMSASYKTKTATSSANKRMLSGDAHPSVGDQGSGVAKSLSAPVEDRLARESDKNNERGQVGPKQAAKSAGESAMLNTENLLAQTASLRALLDGQTTESAKSPEDEIDPGGLPPGAAVEAAPAAADPESGEGAEGDEEEDEEEEEEGGEDAPPSDAAPEAPQIPEAPEGMPSPQDGPLADDEAKNYKSADEDVTIFDADELMNMVAKAVGAAVEKAMSPVAKAIGDLAAAQAAGIEATKAVALHTGALSRLPVAAPRRPGVAVTNGLGDKNPAANRMVPEATKSAAGSLVIGQSIEDRERQVMPAVFAGEIPLEEGQHYVNKGVWRDGFKPSAEAIKSIDGATEALKTTG